MALTLVNGTTDTPRAKPGDVKDPQYEQRRWRHVFPPDVDWHLGLTGEYWIDVLPKLAAGDRIECLTANFELSYELWITEVVSLAQYCRFISRPLFPHTLTLPASSGGEEPRYYPSQGADRLWNVIDRVTGEAVKIRVGRGVADTESETRNAADKNAKALIAARAAGPELVPEEPVVVVEPPDATPAPAVADLGVFADLGDTVAAELAAEPPAVDIDLIDDVTGRPIRRSAEDVASQLAALGRTEAEQPKEVA